MTRKGMAMNTPKKTLLGLLVAGLLAVPLLARHLGPPAALAVELHTVAQRELRPTVLASGVLAFQQEVQLSSELIGPVTELLVREGDRVRRGQPLMRIDARLAEAEVAQQASARRSALLAIERARLQLATQATQMQRSARLVEAGFIAPTQHDEAQARQRLAQVELAASEEQLRLATAQWQASVERLAKTTLRAPMDGTVTALNIRLGETAVPNATGVPGSALATVADDASMLVEVAVDEADIASVAVGRPVRVYPSAAEHHALDGLVQRVALSPKQGPQGRNYTVKVRLDGRHPGLRTGMTARVEIDAGPGQPRPVVPVRAVLSEVAGAEARGEATASSLAHTDRRDRADDAYPTAAGGSARLAASAGAYVFKVVDGRVRKARVGVGLADDAYQEVVQGLAVGDVVVMGPLRALRDLREGEAVAPMAPATPADRRAAAKTAGQPS